MKPVRLRARKSKLRPTTLKTYLLVFLCFHTYIRMFYHVSKGHAWSLSYQDSQVDPFRQYAATYEIPPKIYLGTKEQHIYSNLCHIQKTSQKSAQAAWALL